MNNAADLSIVCSQVLIIPRDYIWVRIHVLVSYYNVWDQVNKMNKQVIRRTESLNTWIQGG
jgi:hypothetical protein